MRLYSLLAEQYLPLTLTEAWDFMSSPVNLKEITPASMGFDIHSGYGEGKMYPGMVVAYTVRPLLGLPITWITEITHVRDNEYFVDEQRFGPYKFWHHKHFLEAVPGGVRIRDELHYALPMGMLGRMVHPFLVKSQLIKIFTYRHQKLVALFPRKPEHTGLPNPPLDLRFG